MKITENQLRKIIRKELLREMSPGESGIAAAGGGTPASRGMAAAKNEKQDLSKPIPIDDLRFVDEDGNGSMMFPGVGYSYSVSEENFEAEKLKIKKRFGDDVMISVPNPGYPKSKKLHSPKFDKAQSRENQNFMRHQRMMRGRLGREPSLGS